MSYSSLWNPARRRQPVTARIAAPIAAVVARPFMALLADGFVAAPDYGGVRIVFRGVQADRADRRARGGGFHQRLAAGQYDAIYDNAAPAFRTSLNRSDSAKFFTAIRKKNGRLQDAGRGHKLFHQRQHVRHERAASLPLGMREWGFGRDLGLCRHRRWTPLGWLQREQPGAGAQVGGARTVRLALESRNRIASLRFPASRVSLIDNRRPVL